jgi:hypothetical protein
MKELVEYIAKSIVSEPDAVVVTEVPNEEGVTLRLEVAEGDKGRIIGRQGQVVQAMRTLLRVTAIRKGTRVQLEIV